MTCPEHQRTIARYRHRAAAYDASAQRTMPYRVRTIARLGLTPGQTVLDVACGTGLSFPLLRQGVGPAGRVIGVEISPEMATLARRRIAAAGWHNVELVECSVEHARMAGPLDAILFNYTHDVLRSPAALANVFAQARSGARVAAAGMKLVSWWLAPINLFVILKARPYATTLEGLERPWSLLASYLNDWRVESTMVGTGYLGYGAVRPHRIIPGRDR